MLNDVMLSVVILMLSANILSFVMLSVVILV
jgi:hypothetical protein